MCVVSNILLPLDVTTTAKIGIVISTDKPQVYEWKAITDEL
jgi:hypothetical protein